MIHRNSSKKGFTLVETIVVVFIFTLLAVGVGDLFKEIFISSRGRLAAIDSIDQARLLTTRFTNEIRVASAGVDGSYPITQTNDEDITFYSSYGQPDGGVARITYYLATSTLYKGVTTPSGDPLDYNLSEEKITTVLSNISNNGEPIFYYYDGDYNGNSPALTQPINVNDIKYVKINLNIFKNNQTATSSTFTISAGSAIRNLKTNLGN